MNKFRLLLFSIISLLFVQVSFAQNLEKKAQSGNAQAMFELAQEYYRGQGRLQSYQSALVWFENAAKKNNLEATYRAGLMYEEGKGTKEDKRKAFNYFVKAAESGHFDSQLKISQMYENGEGTQQSLSRAYLWYRVCAEREEEFSCKKLGDFFRKGIVVNKDHAEAKYWYEKALSKAEDKEAKLGLAYLYVAEESVAPNHQKAKELIKESLDNKEPFALFIQGLMQMRDGKETIALENIKKASNSGCKEATEYLSERDKPIKEINSEPKAQNKTVSKKKR